MSNDVIAGAGMMIAAGTAIFGTLIPGDTDTILLTGIGTGLALMLWAGYRKEPDDALLPPRGSGSRPTR